MIPAVAMFLAVLLFIMGSGRYRKLPPGGSSLKLFFTTVYQSAKNNRNMFWFFTGLVVFVPALVLTFLIGTFDDPDNVVPYTAFGLILIAIVLIVVFGQNADYVQSLGSESAKGMAQLILLFPFNGFVIIFWAVYGQMTANFIVQGCQMDLRIGSIEISGANMSLLDTVVIIAFIPVFDSIIYPYISRVRGKQLRALDKIYIGFGFGVLAMIVSGLVEIYRKSSGYIPLSVAQTNCAVKEGSPTPLMSNLSVLWQIPQYMLVGTAEILISIPMYDLFYSEVPPSIRSVAQALNLLTSSYGSAVAAAVTAMFSKWLPDDLAKGHMEYMYFFLAILCAITGCLCYYVSMYGYGGKGYNYVQEISGEADAQNA